MTALIQRHQRGRMKLNEFITVAAISGTISAGGALAVYAPPCEINKDSLKTIEHQNDRLSDQNDKLSDANRVIQEALAKLPDDQQRLVKLIEENEFKRNQLSEEIKRFQEGTLQLEQTPCKESPKARPEPDEGASLETGDLLLGLADQGKKLLSQAD